jgi:hypothetical protein
VEAWLVLDHGGVLSVLRGKAVSSSCRRHSQLFSPMTEVCGDCQLVKVQRMLEEQVRGLSPIERADKMESITLDVAKLFADKGNRQKELFWLDLAQTSRNEASRLRRERESKLQ